MTAKIEPENREWLNAMQANVFPWITLSALINVLFTWMRLMSAAGNINITPAAVQDLLRNPSQESRERNEGIPGIQPKSFKVQRRRTA